MRRSVLLFSCLAMLSMAGCSLSNIESERVSHERHETVFAMQSGIDLSQYDSDKDGIINDNEFFDVIDFWIARQITDSLFFQLTDAWINQSIEVGDGNAQLLDITASRVPSGRAPGQPRVWRISATLEIDGNRESWSDKMISVVLVDPNIEGPDGIRARASWSSFDAQGRGSGEFLDSRGNPVLWRNAWQLVITLSCGVNVGGGNSTIRGFTVHDLIREIEQTPKFNC